MKNINKNRYLLSIMLLLILIVSSCENFLEAPLPPNQMTSDKIFGTKSTLDMAMLGAYGTAAAFYGQGSIVMNTDQLADNLNSNPPAATDVRANSAYDATNSESLGNLWDAPYKAIYQLNMMLLNLPTATAKLTPEERDHYIAQSLFLRAMMYFDLVRLYGDVPLILNPDPPVAKSLARTPKAEVYASVIADLKEAMNKLPESDIAGLDASRCANKYVAEALLARVYLFMGDYANAESAATDVINSGNYGIEPDLTAVLMRRSTEIIFAFAGSSLSSTNCNWYYALYGMPPFYQDNPEPYAYDYSGWGCLTQNAIDEFEAGDKRFSTLYSYSIEGNMFTLKYPYNTYFEDMADADPQDFCILRLSEMYMIRSEARALKSSPDLAGAAEDLNLVRTTHGGLPAISPASQSEMLTALEHENRVEFMCEAHRWFDLVRTNRADAVLSQLDYKTGWAPHKVLLPIPSKEIINNPNLLQNPLY